MCFVIRRGTGGTRFLSGGDIQQKTKLQIFDLTGITPPPTQLPPLVRHLDLPIRKNLMRVLGLFTVRVFSFKATNLQHVMLTTN